MGFKFSDDVAPQDIPTTKTGLQKFTEGAFKFAESQIRGGRGIGVGSQKILSAAGPAAFLPSGVASDPTAVMRMAGAFPEALERAAAATQPGYRPRGDERLGALAGEIVFGAPLAFATGGFVPPQARLAYKMIGGAISGGTMAALYSKVEEGKIDPNIVAFSSVIGGAIPLIKPLFSYVKNIISGAGDVAASSVGLRPGTRAVASEMGSAIRDVDGSTVRVMKQVDEIQGTLGELHEAAGNQLNVTRKSLGLPATLAEKGERRFGKRLLEESLEIDPKRVANNPGYAQVKYNDQPLILPKSVVENLKNEMAEKYGEEITSKTPKQVWNEAGRILEELTTGAKKGMDEKAKLKTLDFLREKIGDYTDYAKSGLSVEPITKQDSAIFNDLLARTNRVIEGTGRLGKRLRQSESLYGRMRDFYDTFQQNFATDEKAARTVLGLLRNELPDDVFGTGQNAIAAIKEVEAKSGKKFMESLRRSLAKKNLNEMRAQGVWSIPAAGFGEEGLPTALRTLDKVGGAIGAIGDATLQPSVRSLAISAGSRSLTGQ